MIEHRCPGPTSGLVENASARGNIGRAPFATPAGQRSVSERAPDARLPPAQVVASSATGDGIRSWLTAPVQILSSLGSSLAKNHDKEKDPGFIPATQPAHLPAIDLLADLNRSGQAKEFGLKFHWFTSMPLVGCTVKTRERSTESIEGRGAEV